MISTQDIFQRCNFIDMRRPEESPFYRPCRFCAGMIEGGDLYCADCGEQVFDFYDAINEWEPDQQASEKLHGAELARAVRSMLSEFKCHGLKVRTVSGGYVHVTIPALDVPANDSPRYWDDSTFVQRFHLIRQCEIKRALQTKLRNTFAGTSGLLDANPYADYMYLILPSISVD